MSASRSSKIENKSKEEMKVNKKKQKEARKERQESLNKVKDSDLEVNSRFSEDNLGKTVLLYKNVKHGITDVFDRTPVSFKKYVKGSFQPTRKNIWDMDRTEIFHHNDLTFTEFPISSYHISKYKMMFVENSIDNGELMIGGKRYYMPNFTVVTHHHDASKNNFTNSFVHGQFYDEDKDGVRLFFHKANFNYVTEDLLKKWNLCNVLEEILIEKSDTNFVKQGVFV